MLGFIQRLVRFLQKCGDLRFFRVIGEPVAVTFIRRGADGDAHADGHMHFGSGRRDLKGVGVDGLAQPIRRLMRRGRVDVAQDDQEFFAADTRDHILPTQRITQAFRCLDQDGVAGQVTVLIIDPFKVIEVGHDDSKAFAGFGRPAHRMGQVGDGIAAIVQAGHRVDQGGAQAISHG